MGLLLQLMKYQVTGRHLIREIVIFRSIGIMIELFEIMPTTNRAIEYRTQVHYQILFSKVSLKFQLKFENVFFRIFLCN